MDDGVVLVLLRHYLPGYQAGGPVRTVANLVERLSDRFYFRIITSDRDALDDRPYPNVRVDEWNRVGQAEVYYASPAGRSFPGLVRLLRTTPHRVLYLNSFFESTFTVPTMVARWLGLLPHVPLVIAPRGEFSPEALKLKRWKKTPYLAAAVRLGLYRDCIWQASSDLEAADIRHGLGPVAKRVVVAPNLPRLATAEQGRAPTPRRPGEALRVVFLSRIAPMKNLAYALRVLQRVTAPVHFDIYGPVGDASYWADCQRILVDLPSHVTVAYRGAVEHAAVPDVLVQHDLFLLPTCGENYGHAIAEALTVGTPVLIADTTQWRDLEEAGAGWSLPLRDPDRFARCIDACARLGVDESSARRARVRAYARTRLQDESMTAANLRLFEDAVAPV